MNKLHRFFKYTFLYLQLRYDLWRTERELRRDDVDFDLFPVARDNELIQETKAFWGKKTGKAINDSEAIEIIRNFSNFILLLKGEKNE